MRRQVELRISLFVTVLRNVACVQHSLHQENIVIVKAVLNLEGRIPGESS